MIKDPLTIQPKTITVNETEYEIGVDENGNLIDAETLLRLMVTVITTLEYYDDEEIVERIQEVNRHADGENLT